MQELENKLRAYVEGNDESTDLYKGQARSNREAMALIGGDEDWQTVAQAWMNKGKYDKLLAFWSKGLSVDWNGLYVGNKPIRISLPTYPFAKERYWVIKNEGSLGQLSGDRQVSEESSSSKEFSRKATTEALKLIPIWDETLLPIVRNTDPTMEEGRIILINGTMDSKHQLMSYFPQAEMIDINGSESTEMIKKKLQHGGDVKRIVWLSSTTSTSTYVDGTLLDDQENILISGFRLIKAVLELGYEAKALRWDVFTVQAQTVRRNEWANPVDAGIYGLMGTLAREYPSWSMNIVDMEEGVKWPLSDALDLPPDRYGQAWVYRDQRWQRRKLAMIKDSNQPNLEEQRMNGVYVVIGGAGGIGEVWTEHMIRNYKAQVVWIGRRACDEVIQSKLDALAALGPAPLYLVADASDLDALEQVYVEIKNRFGAIHGVVHAAVDLFDQSIKAMDENRFRNGLKAKTDVSIRMAQVFRHEMLDFVLFFSSMNSFVKTPGQSNYVTGCLFKDSVAHRLSLEWSCKVKVMNWGYWGDVGAGASALHRELMNRVGIASIESAEAMEALESLLHGPLDQMVFVKTSDRASIRGIVGEEVIEIYPETLPTDIDIGQVFEDLSDNTLSIASQKHMNSETGSTLMLDNLQAFMLKHASVLLQVGLEEIHVDVDLYEYGFDLILLTELVTLVNRTFGIEMTPLALIENPTILSFSRYVNQIYGDNIATVQV
ncbi:beta-ketoacyl reductase [Bacillus thuringiensis]|uniref:beta-ketoacyl reductase n=2 Tax=Bacillus thuringiensis TaxID=1428 RepID=UPI00125EE683|nr:beta-ketoacyl reductase [Bacillus thuringiensis]QFQ28647.1 SDR family NAD(P)-dependent oxidoreductase [Bacillus thuringiensis]